MYFKSLDGMRGICALMLCVYHFTAYNHFLQLDLFRNAYLFVDFFFVLSGFVIAHTYNDRLSETKALGAFIITRFGRLWPLHAAILLAWFMTECLLLILAHYGFYNGKVFQGGNTLGSLLPNLLFLNAYGVIGFLSWNFPSWTIGAEFYTYIIFALCLFFLKKNFNIATALLIALIGLGFVAYLAPLTIGLVENGGFFRCLYGFFIGVAVFYIRNQPVHFHWNITLKPYTVHLLEILLVIGCILFVSWAGRSVWTLALPVFFAVIVYVFSYEKGCVTKALSYKPFQILGLLSYSIYMVHALIAAYFGHMFKIMEKLTGEMSRKPLPSHFNNGDVLNAYHVINIWMIDLITLFYIAVVLGVSYWTYRYIEAPARDYFKNVARKYQNRTPISQSSGQTTTPFLNDQKS